MELPVTPLGLQPIIAFPSRWLPVNSIYPAGENLKSSYTSVIKLPAYNQDYVRLFTAYNYVRMDTSATKSQARADMEDAIKFQRLKQTGSAERYVQEFKRLSRNLTQETFLASLFFVGLKGDIQDKIFQLAELPATLEAMREKALDFESKLQVQC